MDNLRRIILNDLGPLSNEETQSLHTMYLILQHTTINSKEELELALDNMRRRSIDDNVQATRLIQQVETGAVTVMRDAYIRCLDTHKCSGYLIQLLDRIIPLLKRVESHGRKGLNHEAPEFVPGRQEEQSSDIAEVVPRPLHITPRQRKTRETQQRLGEMTSLVTTKPRNLTQLHYDNAKIHECLQRWMRPLIKKSTLLEYICYRSRRDRLDMCFSTGDNEEAPTKALHFIFRVNSTMLTEPYTQLIPVIPEERAESVVATTLTVMLSKITRELVWGPGEHSILVTRGTHSLSVPTQAFLNELRVSITTQWTRNLFYGEQSESGMTMKVEAKRFVLFLNNFTRNVRSVEIILKTDKQERIPIDFPDNSSKAMWMHKCWFSETRTTEIEISWEEDWPLLVCIESYQ